MDIDDQLLMAFVDGEVDAETQARVEAAMAADRRLRARIEAHRRLRGVMAGAFGSTLNAPATERLAAAARGEGSARATRPAEIVDLAAVRARKTAPKAQPAHRSAWVQWTALAACVAVGVILARGLGAIGAAPMIADHHGTLVAQGALARALDQQVAGAPSPPDQAVKVLISFRATDKLYCRTFQVIRGDGLAGVACRNGGDWQVRAAAAAPSRRVVSAAVDEMIEGAPLDAQAEAAAKAKGWRS